MIQKKEFYYMRHGETDINLLPPEQQINYPDIGLNATGRAQASAVEPLIANLPVHTICCSPLKRAKETRDLCCQKLRANHYEIPSLTECDLETWKQMTALGKTGNDKKTELVDAFLKKVAQGINEALIQKDPVLIIAHGGIFWAACHLMEIEHEKELTHCTPVHLSFQNGRWNLQKLDS